MCDSMIERGAPAFQAQLNAKAAQEYSGMCQSSFYLDTFAERVDLFETPLSPQEFLKLSAVSFVVCVYALEGHVLTDQQIASMVAHLLGSATPCANARLWASFLKGQAIAYDRDIEAALR